MYKFDALQSDTPPSPEQLEKLGVEGWEFVQVIFWPAQDKFYTYLRKPATVQ